jgi:hypothetical protein
LPPSGQVEFRCSAPTGELKNDRAFGIAGDLAGELFDPFGLTGTQALGFHAVLKGIVAGPLFTRFGSGPELRRFASICRSLAMA